jgi:hypothetical protein
MMLWFALQGCDHDPDLPAGARAPEAADTAPLLLPEVNVGVIPRGGRREFVARLTNPSNRTVRWSVLRTSCKCLSVIAGKNWLDPSDDVLARISLHAPDEARFVGNLAIEVTALSPDGTEVVRFNVLAEVVPEHELAFALH